MPGDWLLKPSRLGEADEEDDNLSDREQTVRKLRLEGYSLNDLAALLHVTPQRVGQLERSARAKVTRFHLQRLLHKQDAQS